MTVSNAARQAMWASETGDGLCTLMTLTHSGFTGPIRICNAGEDVTSRGEEYVFYPFRLGLPDETEGSPPVAKLMIQNVSQEITNAIRLIATAVDVLIEIVRFEDLDTVEMALPLMQLRNAKADAVWVTGELSIVDIFRVAYPAGSYNPTAFRSLFT